MPRGKKARRWCPPAFPALEEELLKWITDRRQQGAAVSVTEVRITAMLLVRSIPGTSNFKASYEWGRRFMQRHNLSVRCRSKIAQRLPDDFEYKLVEFQKYILDLRKR